jgi:hypothetical protein
MFGKIKQGFTYLVWKYLPSCKNVTALASRSLEKDLSFREKIILKVHLATCLACQRYLQQIKFMGKVCEAQAEKIEQGENAPQLSPQASERLKNALKSSKF